MSSKIFKSILLVAFSTLLGTLLIITACMFDYFETVQKNQLVDELSIAARGTEAAGKDFLNQLDSKNYRITWVSKKGKVLFDNETSPANMENHAYREEIKEAFKNGTGSSSRYSTTLTEKTLYEAVRLTDGTVLRISVSRITVVVLLLGVIQPILIIGILAILLSAVLGKRMAKHIVDPLNRLNLDNPLENDTYEELSPLLRRIQWQQNEIQRTLSCLKQKQDEFHQITSNMRESLILLDNAGAIITINLSAQKLFRVTDTCIGRNIIEVDRHQNIRDFMQESMENGHAEFREHRNGREYQFDLSRILSDDEVVGTVILAFDITEQAEAERRRREFTANVSHELKTPLQGIIGYTDLMESGLAKPEDIPRFVGHIRKEASRLVTLIEDIIRLSQLDEGTDMPISEVSLGNLADEVCEILFDSAKSKNISLSWSCSDGNMCGVQRLLYEIIYNLCDNAIKYNRSGGSVKIAVSEDDKYVRLEVADTGIGIPEEYQERVFERFYRMDKSHSKQSGGTGLGLSIVKHAVTYHHGKIALESEPNQGTVITVEFPKKSRSCFGKI
ncbi:sensor histidine kinase [Solobacterium moorei]|uniref:sensor histidine kinase n=1 Tax=Solobacterium moorei TaxID=102148 RepID=UPI0003FAD7AA|nr:ATP-binding protein [Solobacterium moorei]BET22003.1 ATP-binding protein [Solobacterium moorei]